MTNIKTITRLAVVAALYVVFTVINPFSYGFIQFRVSEILVLLCFYRRDYGVGLIIGCFIANFFNPEFFLPDIIFGTMATAISVILIARSKNLLIASIYPVIINGIIIGAELYFFVGLPLVASMLYVALGQFVVISIVGVILFKLLEKNKNFMNLIEADQNI